MSKFCGEKLSCEVCWLLHPTVLYMKSKDKATPKGETSDKGDVPVQVKTNKGNKVVTSYAVLG